MKTLRRACTLSLGLFLACTLVWAQENEEFHHSFGCSSTHAESTFSAELNHPSKMQLVPVTDAHEIQQAEFGAFHTLYSKIDSGKYQVSRVDFYMHQDQPKDRQNSAGYAPLTIYVRRTSSEQTSWWKVVEGEREDYAAPFLSARLPNVDEEKPSSPASILPATGDRTVPIFDVKWGSWQPGVSVDDIEGHFLLDLRPPQPKIVADLSCNSVTAFGACGVYDAQEQERTNYECDWIPANDDFRCESTSWHESSKRQTETWFELISGNDIPFSVPAGNPATLQKLAELAEADPAWRNRPVDLPGLGKTSDFLRLPVTQNSVVHVLGAYGGYGRFGAQFFYVILGKDHAPQLGYLVARSLFEDDVQDVARDAELKFQSAVAEQQALPSPASEIKLGGDLSFGVKDLFSATPTHIYQVMAREDTSRAVYWLAIDDQQADGRPLFSMTKLASNVFSYASCARDRSETSAAKITIQKGPNFRAFIDVEAPHSTSETGGIEPPDTENGVDAECPYSLHLEWNHKEWVTDQPVTHCPRKFSPRAIAIADDGTITAAAQAQQPAPSK